jgi:hypothetical protein
MDLLELRVLAVGGILLLGVVLSTLAVSAVAVAGWIGRLRHRASPRATAVASGRTLDAGRARC